MGGEKEYGEINIEEIGGHSTIHLYSVGNRLANAVHNTFYPHSTEEKTQTGEKMKIVLSCPAYTCGGKHRPWHL